MITLSPALDRLHIRFPELDDRAQCEIGFQRTLRLPDDGRTYPLPAGLGQFPLRHIDDFTDRLPAAFVKRGGVIMPMWQAEAMWLRFDATRSWPCAVKIAAGKINAVTGAPWTTALQAEPQDYVVVPRQPWLDGFCVEKGPDPAVRRRAAGRGYHRRGTAQRRRRTRRHPDPRLSDDQGSASATVPAPTAGS